MNTEHFQSRLEDEKARLETQLLTVGRRNPSNLNDWEPVPNETSQESDPIDVAENIEGYEGNAAILKDLEIRYNHVLAALERMSAGTYGICTISGEPIDEARLEADPAATTCIKHLT